MGSQQVKAQTCSCFPWARTHLNHQSEYIKSEAPWQKKAKELVPYLEIHQKLSTVKLSMIYKRKNQKCKYLLPHDYAELQVRAALIIPTVNFSTMKGINQNYKISSWLSCRGTRKGNPNFTSATMHVQGTLKFRFTHK